MSQDWRNTPGSEPEFEMLVNVLIAMNRIKDASEWCTGGPVMQSFLRDAHKALEHVKGQCSEENQRLAEGQVNG